jgi:hypothetical protein
MRKDTVLYNFVHNLLFLAAVTFLYPLKQQLAFSCKNLKHANKLKIQCKVQFLVIIDQNYCMVCKSYNSCIKTLYSRYIQNFLLLLTLNRNIAKASVFSHVVLLKN